MDYKRNGVNEETGLTDKQLKLCEIVALTVSATLRKVLLRKEGAARSARPVIREEPGWGWCAERGGGR